MMKLLAATTNEGKIREIEKLLTGSSLEIEFYSLADFNITADCPERGETFLENSIEKSLFYSRMKGDIYTIADDSGLAVEALGGRPGVHSARYAGEPKDDGKNIQKLLLELNNTANRKAKFTAVVTLAKNGRVIKSFTGEVEGIILKEKRGTGGFGYDPIFYYPPLQKTFAQLTAEEKNQISHRAIAFKKLKEFLIVNDIGR
ncbi:MAG: RdgB/HAM1 family non-canonical purine NTP pyrophosphatase [Candidatus Aminicenantes bacterium]|nr:MAG: RdgB/HAM1 family non-canonical purine NTP pyrophosphatase [Candidatus Aminicenantes bacterium]